MAHIAKFKQGGINGLLLHDGRAENDGHAHSNEEIDNSRTHLNYDLCQREGTLSERFRERLGQVRCMKRDDINVLDCMVVHLPEDIRKGDERKFFEACYKFACGDFGEKNIISGNVHRDEVREHIHINFIPVIEGKRRNGEPVEKVCHDKLITREYYKKLHERLSDFVAEQLGYEVSILNGATAGGNKTVQELKAQKLAEENAKAEQELHQKQEQALAYDLSSPKRFTETKEAYEERQRVHQMKVALEEEKKAFGKRVLNYDTEVYNNALEIAKTLTVKRLEDEIDMYKGQAEREAQRALELERENKNLKKQRENVINENDELMRYMDNIRFSDGETALDKFENAHKAPKKNRGMER